MWYNPGIPKDSAPDAFLKQWAIDYRIPLKNLEVLNQEERAAAYEALRSLAYWFSATIVPDYDNFYWMEDEGYSDSDKDMKVLNQLASELLSL
jgi:hypothetical protein